MKGQARRKTIRIIGCALMMMLCLASTAVVQAFQTTELYDLTVNSANPNHGSIDKNNSTPDGQYPTGSEIKVSAIASSLYTFKEWSFSGPEPTDVVFLPEKTSPEATFIMPHDHVTITANFSIRRQLRVIALEGGKIVGDPDGFYAANETADLNASANEGYEFSGWTREIGIRKDISKITDGNWELESYIDFPFEPTAIFYMPSPAINTTLYAHFTPLPRYQVTTLVEPEGSGSISGKPDETVLAGTNIQLTAQANEGYTFKDWTSDDVSLTDPQEPIISFVMPDRDVTVAAHFEEVLTPTVTITPSQAETPQNTQSDPASTLSTQPQILMSIQSEAPQTSNSQNQTSGTQSFIVPFFSSERKMPATGFSTLAKTQIKAQPRELTYGQPHFSINIPALNVDARLVEVPFEGESWAVDWLEGQLGLLSGSDEPGQGTAYIAGHSHLNSTENGPFLALGSLKVNDRIFVRDDQDGLQIFRVYDNQQTAPEDGISIARISAAHPNSMILITCENESVDGGYIHRRVIFSEPVL